MKYQFKARVAAFVGAMIVSGLWSATALTQVVDDEAGRTQIRVACDAQLDGGLSNCFVLSRRATHPNDPVFDRAAVQAAEGSRAWPRPAGSDPQLIHFPIIFQLEPDYERQRGLRPPLQVRAPESQVATVPPAPAEFPGRAWGGLRCVVAPEGELRHCERDHYARPGGVLGGDLTWNQPVRTGSGEVINPPETLPSLPAEVRDTWALIPTDNGGFYSKTVSGSDGFRLVWNANFSRRPADSPDMAEYTLWELDCVDRRSRLLFGMRGDGRGVPRSDQTYPDNWYEFDDAEGAIRGWADGVCTT